MRLPEREWPYALISLGLLLGPVVATFVLEGVAPARPTARDPAPVGFRPGVGTPDDGAARAAHGGVARHAVGP